MSVWLVVLLLMLSSMGEKLRRAVGRERILMKFAHISIYCPQSEKHYHAIFSK